MTLKKSKHTKRYETKDVMGAKYRHYRMEVFRVNISFVFLENFPIEASVIAFHLPINVKVRFSK